MLIIIVILIILIATDLFKPIIKVVCLVAVFLLMPINKVISGGKYIHNKKHFIKYGYINGNKRFDKFVPLNKIKFYDEYSRMIIVDGLEPILDHSRNAKQDKIPLNILHKDPQRILNMDSKPRLNYSGDYMGFTSACHWGQLKLFLSEIEFLTRAYADAKMQNKEDKIIFVYAGAAPGEHTKFLHSMFPTVKFVLIDPNPFSKDLFDVPNITVLNDFYTFETAEYFKQVASNGHYIAFCSDIRTYPPTEAMVIQDMKMQFDWWKQMNSDLSMFKFRLPWGEDSAIEKGISIYPEGDIYIQCYPKNVSSETRIIVKKDALDITYDDELYESLMYSHNMIYRSDKYILELGELKLTDGPLYIDNCYDCASFVVIVRNYIDVVLNKKGDLELMKQLIIDIQNNSTTYINSPKTVLDKTKMEYRKQVLYNYNTLMLGYVNKNKQIYNAAHEGNQDVEQIKIKGTYPDLFDTFIYNK